MAQSRTRFRDRSAGLLDALSAAPAPRLGLKERREEALDERVLRRLAGEEPVARRAADRSHLLRLWDVCQTPDFRKTTLDDHVRLVGDLFAFTCRRPTSRRVPDDWMAQGDRAASTGWMARSRRFPPAWPECAPWPMSLTGPTGWPIRYIGASVAGSSRTASRTLCTGSSWRGSSTSGPAPSCAALGDAGEVLAGVGGRWNGHRRRTLSAVLALSRACCLQPGQPRRRRAGAESPAAPRPSARWRPEVARRLGALAAEAGRGRSRWIARWPGAVARARRPGRLAGGTAVQSAPCSLY